ncbi:bifunctional lytic transglycosylase/C40 family peptidase [Priestia megaterium]|uniref:bifunctional lytic transglycosylase/C40 family peptidase n=1 Tax=Priestia megaterium TaxID=1404 RepID=UPI002E1FB401|nr:bifunctional lytic transglycosylase/C40 family peptidase [Priestia megaterium]
MHIVLQLIPKKYLIGGTLILLGLSGLLIMSTIVAITGEFESDSQQSEVTEIEGGGIGVGTANVSPQVMKYQPLLEKYAQKHGLDASYVPIMMALMMQESGGRGNDPMQSSESKCGRVGCIQNPEASIDQGVKHFKSVLEKSHYDLKLCLQSYNFGPGFINFIMKNGGKYTPELAIKFSQIQYQQVKHTGKYHCVRPEMVPYQACYGDSKYVDAVLKYYTGTITADGKPAAPASGGSGGKSGVKVIDAGKTLIGKTRYVFGGGRSQSDINAGRFDCSSFVRWAFEQVGMNVGPMSGVTTDTLKTQGQAINPKDMKPGDVVFFDTYKIDGHIGIYVGNNQFLGCQGKTGVAIASMAKGTYFGERFNGRVKRF